MHIHKEKLNKSLIVDKRDPFFSFAITLIDLVYWVVNARK